VVPYQANDYCGVHTNSGVLNHWFYILSIGKSGTNDVGSSYNVTGISIDKSWDCVSLGRCYLSANSTFANARTYGIQSAVELYGEGSPEVIATTNAFMLLGWFCIQLQMPLLLLLPTALQLQEQLTHQLIYHGMLLLIILA
jgi:Zn-dependent metalloprotease